MATAELHALYALDGAGGARRVDPADGLPSGDGVAAIWHRLNRDSPQLEETLASIPGLDGLTVEALSEEETRPRCLPHGDGALVILRGVNLNPGSEPEDMVQIRLWVDAGQVVSVQRRQLVAVDDVVTSFAQGGGPKSSGDFLAMLADSLTDHMQATIEEIDESLDRLEDEQDGGHMTTLRSEIAQLHRQVVTLRRFIAPQRDALTVLIREPFAWKTKVHERRFKEIVDRVTRLVEQLDEIQARAVIARESLSGYIAERLNRTMALLSVMASVFLPLTFVTGLLGINVGGLPGAHSPWAFTVVVVALVALAVIEMALVYRFRLLSPGRARAPRSNPAARP
ncbi:MAG: zinc transporter ZntB [Rhodospirillaceae bacterium]|nr:zinc transporter ZntB [Rhodospirillaceae bacterium]